MANLTGQDFGLSATFGQVITKGTTGQLFQDGTGTGVTGTLQTFTPEYVPETGAFASITYSGSRYGRYIKVAENLIWFSLLIQTNSISIGTATGYVRVSVPFTASQTQALSVFSARFSGIGSDQIYSAYIASSTSSIVLSLDNSASTSGLVLQASDLANGGGLNQLFITGFVNATV